MKPKELQERFMSAISDNDHEAFQKLLRAGALVNEPDSENRATTPLLRALDGNCDRIVKDLLAAGADCNLPDADGTTPLMMAAQRDNLENVKVLIRRGADPDVVNENERQGALVFAEDWEVIRFLVASGANLEIRDDSGETPLAVAARIGDERKAEILLDLGADPRAKDDRGLTPLELAKEGKHKSIVELFRSRGLL